MYFVKNVYEAATVVVRSKYTKNISCASALVFIQILHDEIDWSLFSLLHLVFKDSKFISTVLHFDVNVNNGIKSDFSVVAG